MAIPGSLIVLFALVWAGLLLVLEYDKHGRRALDLLSGNLASLRGLALIFWACAGLYLTLLWLGWWYAPVTQGSEFGVHFSSLKLLDGMPAYPARDSGEQYGLLYGPLTYLTYLVAYTAFGVTSAAPKLLAIPVVLTGLWITWLLVREGSSGPLRRFGTGLAVLAALLWFREYVINPKADPLIYLLTALATWASVRRWPLAVIGACAGLAFGFKATAIIAFVPIWAIAQRDGLCWRGHAAAVASFSATSVLPFLHPLVSFADFYELITSASRHAIGSALLFACLFVVLSATTVVLAWTAPGRRRWLWLALLLAALVMSVPASKDMAGSYHLAALLPPFAWLLASEHAGSMGARWRQRTTWFAIFIMAGVLPAQIAMYGNGVIEQAREQARIKSDFDDVLRRYPNTRIGVDAWNGYVERDFAMLHPQLSFLSFWALLDDAMAGKPTPAAVIERIKTCEIPIWLVQHGHPPFSHSFHTARGDIVVPEAGLRHAFTERYALSMSLATLDVWTCKRGG